MIFTIKEGLDRYEYVYYYCGSYRYHDNCPPVLVPEGYRMSNLAQMHARSQLHRKASGNEPCLSEVAMPRLKEDRVPHAIVTSAANILKPAQRRSADRRHP
jgi:hypothetical protein